MRVEIIPLNDGAIGTQRTITALHFGDESAARKIYIQASLHADELPGALTAYHLRAQFLALEQAGYINAHIVLVPLANPIGLSQALHHTAVGRFEFLSGQNFNRLGALNLFELTLAHLQKNGAVLGQDAAANVATIRGAMRQALAEFVPKNALESMHLALVGLAFDADVVLDLHCDERAVLHMYTLPDLWPLFEPLAAHLGSQCQLLADSSGANPFDEALSTAWTQLAGAYPHANIPPACATTTVELRSRADISHAFAVQDAWAIVQFLHGLGDVTLAAADVVAAPALLRPPYPLAGKVYVLAPCAGVVVYHAQAGDDVTAGQLLAELIDPIEGRSEQVLSPIDGVVYARAVLQFTQKGEILASVAGAVDLGRGAGLSP